MIITKILRKHLFTIVVILLLSSVAFGQIYPHATEYFSKDANKKLTTALLTGDEETENPAYDYFYPPPNSFGMKEFKTTNWSYFKQLFQDHFYKDAMYKRYTDSEWTNGNQYVGIEKTWIDDGYWKINITLDIPVDLYEVNISFGCDLPVLQYVEKDGYEIWINYTANETENYSIMFNYSDIANISGLTISKHQENGIWWISLHRNNIPSGYYVFDPTFGVNSITGYAEVSLADDFIRGINDYSPASDGVADNISLYAGWDGYGGDMCFALYDGNTLVGQTSEVSLNSGPNKWYTASFVSPPDIYSATDYKICFWFENSFMNCWWKAETDAASIDADTYDANYPSPISWSSEVYDYSFAVYCSYTASGGAENTAPTYTGSSIWDGTTNHTANTSCVGLTPVCLNITVNDPEGDTMNITWERNGLTLNTTSGSNGTYRAYNTSFADTCGTTYYYNVSINDGNNNWRNQTFSFTTVQSPTIHLKTPTNGSESSKQPTIHIQANDSCGLPLNIFWYDNSAGWTEQQSNLSVAANSSVYWTYDNAKSPCTNHYYRVAVNNTYCNVTYQFYFNTTGIDVTFTGETPSNTSIDNELDITWNVTGEHPEGEYFQIWLNSSHGETGYCDGHNQSCALPINGLDWCTKYYVTVTASSNCTTITEIFEFTTKSMQACTFAGEDPFDTEVGTEINLNWNVTITSPDSEFFNYTIESNSGNTTSGNDQTTGSKVLEMNELSYSTLYTVWVNTTNNCSNDSSAVYHFTTEDAPVENKAPIQSSPSLANNTACVYPPSQICITINDPEGDQMNLTWWSNSSGTWVAFGENLTINNGTYCWNNTNFTGTNTTYYWSINVSDGEDWSNTTYHFTTMRCPYVILTSPANGTTGVSLTPRIIITANDYCSMGLNIFFYQNTSGSWVNNQSNISVAANTTHTWLFDAASQYSTTYYWRVSINNSLCNTTYEFHFTTQAAVPPSKYVVIDVVYPINHSTIKNSTSGVPTVINITLFNGGWNGNREVVFYSNTSGAWVEYFNITVRKNGTYCAHNFNFTNTTGQLDWNVSVSNTTETNKTFAHFFVNSTMTASSESVFNFSYLPLLTFLSLIFVFKRRNKNVRKN